MPRAIRKKKKKSTNQIKKGKTANELAQEQLEQHPEWATSKPVSTNEKNAILETALNRPLRVEEVDKLKQALFDKNHRGNKPDLELVQKTWNEAITKANEVKYMDIRDKNGAVVGKEAIIDYRRKQQNHILKIVQIEAPILSNRTSVINAVQQYFAICLEDGIAYSINGLALALGTTRETLKKWYNGETRVENQDIIQQAFEMVSLQTELDIREGKGNPVGQIFLGKNDSGYVDEVKHTISKSKIDDIDEKELAEKYIGVIDLTEKKA